MLVSDQSATPRQFSAIQESEFQVNEGGLTFVTQKLVVILALSTMMLFCFAADAQMFNGTLYYTTFTGGQNVHSVTYSYNQTTQSLTLGLANNIASLPGADGIIFAPNGNLLVGGQGTGFVFEITKTGGFVAQAPPGSPGQDQNSFHLALDPSGTKFYTSDFRGPLDTVPLPLSQGTTSTLTGGDTGVTQLAFAPNGNVFYVNGNPNGGGNLGLINLSTDVTTQLFTNIRPAHGLIYDPFTGLMTFFGAGETGTMNQNGGNLMLSPSPFNCDFDQGSVDGHGHAFVAGCNSITFLDYSISHDITHPNKVIIQGGFTASDDTAPLVGLGSQVPEPSSLILLGSGVIGLAGVIRRRIAK